MFQVIANTGSFARKVGWLIALFIPVGASFPQSVVINELSASVTSSLVDNYGEFEDWVELYNCTSGDINLAGWYVSDNPLKPGKWKFPADNPKQTTLPAGSYMLLWADKDTAQGPLHLNFSLKKGGEKIILSKPGMTGPVIADSVSYPRLKDDQAYGRCLESGSGWVVLKRPTPGKPNVCPRVSGKNKKMIPLPEPPGYDSQVSVEPVAPVTVSLSLVLNEISANNKRSKADEYGEFDDWIEIRNIGTAAVNLAGWYISDTLNPAVYHRIPASDPARTTIPAGGYLLLWADGQTSQGVTHLPFKLDKGGEEVILSRLVSGQYVITDQTVFPSLKNDVPWGRIPDGSGGWTRLSDPSPLAANIQPRVLSGFLLNELMAASGTGFTDEFGEEEDWLELFNPGPVPVDIGGLYLTDSLGEPARSRVTIYSADSTTIPAGGYLVLFADNDTWQGARHLNFKLAAGGGVVTLVQPDGTTILSSITYGPQAEGYSLGRYPDGSANWIPLSVPSPGRSNGSLSSGQVMVQGEQMEVFPNPVDNEISIRVYLNKDVKAEAKIYSSSGVLQLSADLGRPGSGWNTLVVKNGVSDLLPGQYVLRLKAGRTTLTRAITVVK